MLQGTDRASCHRSRMIINQWVPAAHRGDAIGDSARRMRDLLRAIGHESELYALTIDDDLQDDVRPFDDPAARQGDLTIFHFALPSPMTEAFASLRGGRVLQYHNVTPAAFFAPYDPALFRLASLGRQELATLVGRVDLALGVSDYNRQELEALGFARNRRAAAGRRHVARHQAGRAAGAREDPGRRVRQLSVRRADRAEQEDRGSHPARRALQALRRRVLPLHLRRPLRRGAALLFDDSRADVRVSAARTSASSSPGRFPTRSSPSTISTRRSTSR